MKAIHSPKKLIKRANSSRYHKADFYEFDFFGLKFPILFKGTKDHVLSNKRRVLEFHRERLKSSDSVKVAKSIRFLARV
jgi:hypothetical protein